MSRLLPVLALVLVAACAPSAPADPTTPSVAPSPNPTASGPTLSPRPSPRPTPSPTPLRPLAGVHVALDPGHQLGNSRFPEEVGRIVDAGGVRKACNTTGTATADGWPEATLAWLVVRRVQRRLTELGATVSLTRATNSATRWGPCVDARGRFAGMVGADLLVSVHADGNAPAERGFHVIVAPDRPASRRLAEALRGTLSEAGVARSSYVPGALSVRADLGTLNLATVPAAMVELGNMRNPDEAATMRSEAGQATYARAVVRGIRAFLGR